MKDQLKFVFRNSPLRYYKNIIFKKQITTKKILFIHPPKTSGTYIVNIFKKFNLSNKILCKSHSIKVFQLEKNTKYIISIRDPVDRYMSAFYDARKLYKIGELSSFIYRDIFSKYKTFNSICENIYNNNQEDKLIRKFFF